MDKYGFGSNDVRRIANTVRAVESMPTNIGVRARLLPTDNPGGGGAVHPCVIRSAPADYSRTLQIGLVSEVAGVTAIGPTFDAMTWPGTVTLDFASFVQADGEVLLPHTTVMPATKVGFIWYVLQLPRFAFTNQDNIYRRTDCLPFSV